MPWCIFQLTIGAPCSVAACLNLLGSQSIQKLIGFMQLSDGDRRARMAPRGCEAVRQQDGTTGWHLSRVIF
eukprot:780898-Pyramimonas_sp.AAC.1